MFPEENKQSFACVTCGQVLHGKFCSQCGEKQIRAEEKSVTHFFEEILHLFTHADSKFLKSLKYLFTRPGFLTAEFLTGRRKIYTSPLTLFFIGNLIYFLFAPVDALNSRYASQTLGQPYSKSILKTAEKKMHERHWTPQEMEKQYNAKAGSVSKLLLILLVFFLSIPLTILFYSRNSYYFDHLVFATEFVSFVIYVVLEAIPILLFAFALLWRFIFKTVLPLNLNSDAAMLLLISIITFYIAAGAKRVYKQKWVFPRAVLFTICTFAAVVLYRYILFYVTILWL